MDGYHTDATFEFLNLPRELRDEVYRHMMERHAPVQALAGKFDHKLDIIVLRINHQIREESLDMFFARAIVNQRIPELFLGPKTIPPSMVDRVRRIRLDLPATMIHGQNLFGWFSTDSYVSCDWSNTFDNLVEHMSVFPNLARADVEISVIISMREPGNEAELVAAWQDHALNCSPVLETLNVQIADLGQGASTAWKYSLCKGK